MSFFWDRCCYRVMKHGREDLVTSAIIFASEFDFNYGLRKISTLSSEIVDR
jgi:hypothetical protein